MLDAVNLPAHWFEKSYRCLYFFVVARSVVVRPSTNSGPIVDTYLYGWSTKFNVSSSWRRQSPQLIPSLLVGRWVVSRRTRYSVEMCMQHALESKVKGYMVGKLFRGMYVKRQQDTWSSYGVGIMCMYLTPFGLSVSELRGLLRGLWYPSMAWYLFTGR